MDSLIAIKAYLKDLKTKAADIEHYLDELEKEIKKEPRHIWVNFYGGGYTVVHSTKEDAENRKANRTDRELVEFVEVIK